MKYIVSKEIPQGFQADGPEQYNHDSVKLAYKAGAVVEYWHGGHEKWMDAFGGPGFFSDSKYRALITDDMPQEIQELVNTWVTEAGITSNTPLTEVSFSDKQSQKTPAAQNPKRHKWADVIIAWANGDEIQFQGIRGGGWLDYSNTPTIVPAFYDECLRWRIKPRTIKIGDIEVPAPETKAPEAGARYFVADALEQERLYTKPTWRDDEFDRHALASGMIHLTPQAAQEHALALIKISGGQHPENYEVAK